ncbi:MAG: LPS export ABC transporter permease LptG [Acidiferrobacterales bacterium]|nr:LPS export ABC transporter permease LptG [Acidiferrobacterales bacterium]
MRILNRYLGRIILQYTLISMGVLLALFTFVNFLDQLGSLGKGNYGIWQAIQFVILTIPRLLYELFPMAALLGTIIGLSLLANDSELIVMRASGVSMLQITAAALKMGGIFVICAVLVGEVISPFTETKAVRGRAEALQQNIQQQTNFGLWMRDTQTYVNVGEVLPDLTLLRIKVFEFDPDKRLRSMVTADDGLFQDDSWLISNVKQTLISPDGETEIMATPSAEWQSRVTPQILSVFLIQPDQLSFWQLSRYIKHLTANQQKTDPFELAFWGKLMLPLSTAVMVVLAIPFVFVNIRSGGLGRSLFTGIMLGLGFYAANKGFGYIVLANGLSPFLGATLPVIGFLFLAMVMMRRID